MAKTVDYWDENGNKRRVTKSQYDSIMRGRKKRDEGANARAYRDQMARDAAATRGGSADYSNPSHFNNSTGSVGPPGAYAANDVVGNLLGPFHEIPKAAPAATAAPPAPPAATGDDPMKALLDELMGAIHTDVGAGPNLNDYIGGFAPARKNALDYQTAATGQINAGTAALLEKLKSTGAVATADNAAAAATAKGSTDAVAAAQAAAAAKASADLQAQGVSTAPVDAAALSTGGELAANSANAQSFAAKLAQMQTTEAADRVNSANTMGTGAVGTLGLNTNATLGRLNEGEAAARMKFGQDSAAHSAAASNAASQDVQTRIALAQQFASLDDSTNADPTAAVRSAHPQYGTMWDHLDQGMTPSEVRLDLQTGLAEENKKPAAERDAGKIANAKEALNALQEWEKATAPDAKAEAKKRQVELLRHYLSGPGK